MFKRSLIVAALLSLSAPAFAQVAPPLESWSLLAPFTNAYRALFVINQDSDKATYAMNTGALAVTSSLTVAALEAGPVLRVRLRRICVGPGTATAGVASLLTIARETTASSGGATAVPGAWDPADAPYSGIFRFAAAGVTGGTAGATVWSGTFGTPPVAAASMPLWCIPFDDVAVKPIVVAPGTTNGLTFAWVGTAGGAGLTLSIVVTEEKY